MKQLQEFLKSAMGNPYAKWGLIAGAVILAFFFLAMMAMRAQALESTRILLLAPKAGESKNHLRQGETSFTSLSTQTSSGAPCPLVSQSRVDGVHGLYEGNLAIIAAGILVRQRARLLQQARQGSLRRPKILEAAEKRYKCITRCKVSPRRIATYQNTTLPKARKLCLVQCLAK